MSRRTFATDPGAGGEESEALGLPFISTSCEDYYGFGDGRCPNRYIETGNLETDIKSLEKWIGLYRVGKWWRAWAVDELSKKRTEQSKILAQEQAKETSLPSIYGGQFVSPSQIQLSSEINQILQKIESGQILIPDWFQNTINWVKDGSIPQDQFLHAYNHQIDEGNIHPPEQPMVLLSANVKISFTDSNIGGFSSSIPIDDIGKLQGIMNDNYKNKAKYTLIGNSTNQPISTLSELINNINDLLASVETVEEEEEEEPTITDNMVTQQLINFNIVNGRAVGSIRFVATNNFNPYYYGQNIVNVIQFHSPNGVPILDIVKENSLNFTETERDDVLSYDEDMKGNTRATVASFVLSPGATPTAFSKTFNIEISEKEPPKPLTPGFLGAGGLGAVAVLILIGAAFTIKGD